MNLRSSRSIKNRLWRIGVYSLAALVLLCAVLVIVIETPSFQQWVLRRGLAIVSVGGLEISASGLDIDYWNLAANLESLNYNDG